jgi:hypothetical protein
LISVESLEAAARERSGFSDFGPNSYRPHLAALLDSLQADGGFTESGWRQTQRELVRFLCNRLEIQNWLNRYPEILEENIQRPVFATGLPRSGTTYLLHLFDCDPKLQLLRTWETQSPCPPPGFDVNSIAARVEATRQQMLKVWQESVPGFDAIHLIDVEGPDECTGLLSNDFNQVGFFNYLNVPGYWSYMKEQGDFLASYQYHKQQLQLLQWRRGERRWMLKYPNHLLAMNEIVALHPQVKFVMTHRDPIVCLASLCDLTVQFRGGRSEGVDSQLVGQQMLGFVKIHVDALMKYAEGNAERILHIDYYQLIAEPAEQIKRAYDFIDQPMGVAVESAVVEWIAANPQGKRGEHAYTLAQFGLSRELVEEQFSDYRRAFSIPVEEGV